MTLSADEMSQEWEFTKQTINSTENTQHAFMLKKIEKIILIMPPDLAL